MAYCLRCFDPSSASPLVRLHETSDESVTRDLFRRSRRVHGAQKFVVIQLIETNGMMLLK